MKNKLPVLGIIGGGQLGSMLCEAAKKLNIKTVILSDKKDAPAQNFCNNFLYAKYDNKEAVEKFVKLVDVVTFEFENIPFEILNSINKTKEVLPDPKINQIVQNRKIEKTFINELGIQTTDWAYVESKKDIIKNEHLLPGLLKTTTLGYDGHGQYILNDLNDIKDSWCFSNNFILEKLVNLKKEVSVIITRFKNGENIIYEPIENTHDNQILKKSKIPANINKKIFLLAQENTKIIAEKLNYVGTMCVEYFVSKNDLLLVNEIAPRVHNSGHLTINAFNISQFENHVRAVCELKKLTLNKNSNAEMINILGDEIENYRKQSFSKKEFFFDYLKNDIKSKRKMGHLTILKD